MTTLYRPVLIESAEQAEALPVGTVAYGPETGGLVGIRAPESSYFPWHCSFEHDPTAYSSEVVGWTALVPIEAEEEYVAPDAITYTRYVTAWEEA